MISNDYPDDLDCQVPKPEGEMRRTVLIVDDSRAVRLVLANCLREFGFNVREAADGAAALAAVTTDKSIGLILLDWEMPVMNGIDFLKEWRRSPDWRDDIPVLMVTTISTAERIAEALAAGVNEYVMKPINRELIAAKLDILGIPYQNTPENGASKGFEPRWSS